MERHLPYGTTVLPASWYSIYVLRRDRRLSLLVRSWLHTEIICVRDSRQSPIQIVTTAGVEQLR